MRNFVIAAALLAACPLLAEAQETPPAAVDPKLAEPFGEVVVPLEITDAAPTHTSGALRVGDVIAQHEVRAQDAIVLEEPVQIFGRRSIPAGTPLALAIVQPTDEERRAQGAAPPERRVWCDVRPTGDWSRGSVDCLRDTDGDGRLDRVSTGSPGQFHYSFDIVAIDAPEVMPPVRFRAARIDERPVTRIGYRYCEGRGDTAPARFGLAVLLEGQDRWYTGEMLALCPFGTWPDENDRSVVEVDRFRVRLQGPESARTFSVEDRMPAGPIARPTVGQPLRAAADAESPEDRIRRMVAELRRSPLIAAGAAEVASGRVGRGDSIVSVPVRYGVTGVLRNEVSSSGLFTTSRIAVGTPVYGIPMVGAGGAEVVWCAPRGERGRDGRTRWSGVCLPRDPRGMRHWVNTPNPFFATSLAYRPLEGFASEPTVEEQALDVAGPMSLRYRFVELDDDDADIDVLLTAQGEERLIGQIHPPRAPGEPVLLETLGGVIRLTVAPDDRRAVTVEVVEPLQADGAPALGGF